MKNTNWREIVEIVGVVSIVASLLILATEMRQANRIAVAETRILINNNYKQLHFERATNPEFAKLYAKLQDPDSHLITATEKQQIQGLARQYLNNAYETQVAHQQGFLTDKDIQNAALGFRRVLRDLPGLEPDMLALYMDTPQLRNLAIFGALEELSPELASEEQ